MISHNHTLTIESNDVDVCGNWNAADVEAEMIDLEIPIENDCSWLEYVIENALADYDVDVTTIAKVLKMSYDASLNIMLGDTNIRIFYGTF